MFIIIQFEWNQSFEQYSLPPSWGVNFHNSPPPFVGAHNSMFFCSNRLYPLLPPPPPPPLVVHRDICCTLLPRHCEMRHSVGCSCLRHSYFLLHNRYRPVKCFHDNLFGHFVSMHWVLVRLRSWMYDFNISDAAWVYLRKSIAKAKKQKSLVSGHRSASKSVRWHVFFLSLFLVFFSQQGTMWYMYTRWPNFPLYKVWWLREASQIGQTFIPLYKQVV